MTNYNFNDNKLILLFIKYVCQFLLEQGENRNKNEF